MRYETNRLFSIVFMLDHLAACPTQDTTFAYIFSIISQFYLLSTLAYNIESLPRRFGIIPYLFRRLADLSKLSSQIQNYKV